MTQQAPFSYRGTYINLDRSAARRQHMEAQLAASGLSARYTRFPAVDGSALLPQRSPLKPGETGAFLSHMRALEAARSQGTAVHVLEDDALLSPHVERVIEDAVESGLFDRFDVIFTDTLVSPHLGMLKGLKTAFDRLSIPPSRPIRLNDLQVIDLAQQNFACMTSYIVGSRSIDKVIALYRAECEHGPAKPVDIFLRDSVQSGRLRAGLLFPFVTSFRLDEIAVSTIAGDDSGAKPSVMVLAVLRYLFFVDRDLAIAQSCLDRATQRKRSSDAHHDMVVQALDFVLSEDFQEF